MKNIHQYDTYLGFVTLLTLLLRLDMGNYWLCYLESTWLKYIAFILWKWSQIAWKLFEPQTQHPQISQTWDF